MAFDVSALTNYTKENEAMLVTSLVTGAKTASIIYNQGNLQTNVKSSEKINIIETDATFQVGGTCGFNASGTTTFTQRTITVGKIKVHEALCPKALEAKYTQKALTTGSQYDSLAFATEYTDKKNAIIQKQLETAIWQGDTLSGNANLSKFDGYLKLVDAAVGPVAVNDVAFIAGAPILIATGIVAANVISIFDGMYKALPAELLGTDDAVIFCGWDVFRTLTIALKAANLFHYTGKADENGELVLPGTNIKIIAVHGLNSTNRIISTYLKNLYIGTDMANEEDKYELFFAKEADEMRFMAEWKMGVQFAFPNQIAQFKLA